MMKRKFYIPKEKHIIDRAVMPTLKKLRLTFKGYVIEFSK